MQLTQEQLVFYNENGFLLIPECFSPSEVRRLSAELPALMCEDSQHRVVEREGEVVRSIYGSHTTNDIFRRLSCHPRIVEPARQILNSDVYVYQFKINIKSAFSGDLWDWHQDFIFWQKEDGVPSDRMMSVAVFIDEVNEFNAPMFLIPGSHRQEILEVPAPKVSSVDGNSVYKNSHSWISNLTADIKYSVSREFVSHLVSRFGIVASKGASGSVLFFHSKLVHASSNNISPFDRVIAFVTYNGTNNIPVTVGRRRPDFLCSRDYMPLVIVSDSALLL
jgi:ectoine hydroxylase-related dioxygenase (phytanoyl-CoA dioxygenase family)